MTPEELKKVLTTLADLSTKTWTELESERSGQHKKHHGQPVATLCKAARQRLEETGLSEDYAELFRFRFGGRHRLWGVRDGFTFHVIWADMNHQVYPTDRN